MARDAKQVFRFVQTAQVNNNNQLLVQNQNASTTIATQGATFTFGAVGTAGLWAQGISTTLNRAGFRTVIADQTNMVTGETNGIPNDPALFGNTNGFERYCHVVIAPFGAIPSIMRWEVYVEGASDSGVGTAGNDWTAISSSIPVPTNTGYLPTSAFAVVNGVGTLNAHGFEVGDILLPRAAGTNIAIYQPMYVVATPTINTFNVSKTPGSGIIDTTISVSSAVHDRPRQRRVLAIPISPNPKPWVRVVVRAIPNGSVTVPAINTGVVIDSAYLTMGRDCASLF